MTFSGWRASGGRRGLGGLVDRIAAFEESIGTAAPRRIAERVAAELQDAGPNWTGEFMNAWRIAPGDQDIPATIGRAPAPKDQTPAYNPAEPIRQRVPPVSLSRRFGSVFTNNKTIYTIGNASRHRLVAMDLSPRDMREPPRTAPFGWFETYMQGGQFRQSASVELSRAIREARGGGAR